MSADRKPSILVTGADLAEQAVQTLAAYELVYAGARPTEAQLIALMQRHDPQAVIVRYGRMTRAVIEAGRSLRVISKHGSGIDTIDVGAAQARNIAVCAATGVNANAVAEHALALLLACAKSVPYLDQRMHLGHWDKSMHKSIELRGKTIGLIGLGAIGSRMADFCAMLGMRVIAFDPGLRDAGQIGLTALDTIWAEADVISLHCPLTPENTGLINGPVLAKCRAGVIVINTARGGLIDETALLAAVRAGRVFAAGLDSFALEPLAADHPFLGEPRMILSPHVGGVTQEAYVGMGVAAARNILEHLASVPETPGPALA